MEQSSRILFHNYVNLLSVVCRTCLYRYAFARQSFLRLRNPSNCNSIASGNFRSFLFKGEQNLCTLEILCAAISATHPYLSAWEFRTLRYRLPSPIWVLRDRNRILFDLHTPASAIPVWCFLPRDISAEPGREMCCRLIHFASHWADKLAISVACADLHWRFGIEVSRPQRPEWRRHSLLSF
jgi:hypothetical protein